MPPVDPPSVEDVIPGLTGRGVVPAGPARATDLARSLRAAGYEVILIDGAHVWDRQSALRALAASLGLPGAADRNLDALLDTLRDLPDRFPSPTGVALVWRDVDRLVRRSPTAWVSVRDVLRRASDELRAHGYAFETIACGLETEAQP
ncbi:MAG: barstar family protein [Dermatophilaceae bacterium]